MCSTHGLGDVDARVLVMPPDGGGAIIGRKQIEPTGYHYRAAQQTYPLCAQKVCGACFCCLAVNKSTLSRMRLKWKDPNVFAGLLIGHKSEGKEPLARPKEQEAVQTIMKVGHQLREGDPSLRTFGLYLLIQLHSQGVLLHTEISV